jgi:hypothetical protein
MSSNGGGARILIVDDEPQIRRFLSAGSAPRRNRTS